jgi:hypothetical protein
MILGNQVEVTYRYIKDQSIEKLKSAANLPGRPAFQARNCNKLLDAKPLKAIAVDFS